MSTYLFYLVITVLAATCLKLYSSVRQREFKIVFLVGSFLSLFLPLVLRDVSVGVDYIRYKDTFYDIINMHSTLDENIISWLGWPFIYLTKLCAPLVFDNYIIFYGLISFIGLIFLYGAVLRSKIPWLSLLLFITFCLYFQMFNQMRQMIAICIILYSIKYIQLRSPLKFLLTVGLASVFHMTALIFIPMYVLASAKITGLKPFLYISTGILLAVFSPIVIQLVGKTPYGEAYLGTWYDIAFSLTTIQNFGVRLVILVGCLVLMKKTLKANPDTLVLYNVVIYCTILQVLAIYSAAFGRVTTMFFVAYILLIPAALTANYRGSSYQKSVAAVILIAFIYQYVYYTAPSGAASAGYDSYRLMHTESRSL